MASEDQAAGRRVTLDWPLPEVLRIRIDRPECRNAVDGLTVGQLTEAFSEGARRAGAVVLAANGSFCAGMDLSLPLGERATVSERLYVLYRLMVELPVPIVAAANGHAVGAGAQLLLASDLRVASLDLRVRFPGPEHGLSVGTWGLPSLVGRGRAMDLALTMRALGAEEARAIGLVDRIEDDPEAAAVELAASLAGLDRDAVASTKSLIALASGHIEALRREANRNATASRKDPRAPH